MPVTMFTTDAAILALHSKRLALIHQDPSTKPQVNDHSSITSNPASMTGGNQGQQCGEKEYSKFPSKDSNFCESSSDTPTSTAATSNTTSSSNSSQTTSPHSLPHTENLFQFDSDRYTFSTKKESSTDDPRHQDFESSDKDDPNLSMTSSSSSTNFVKLNENSTMKVVAANTKVTADGPYDNGNGREHCNQQHDTNQQRRAASPPTLPEGTYHHTHYGKIPPQSKLIPPPQYQDKAAPVTANTTTSSTSAKKMVPRRAKKIQPLVYSAIGSLENVNQSDFRRGCSFDYRLQTAAKLQAKSKKKTRRHNQEEFSNLNSETSQINNRLTEKMKKCRNNQAISCSALTNPQEGGRNHDTEQQKRSNISKMLVQRSAIPREYTCDINSSSGSKHAMSSYKSNPELFSEELALHDNLEVGKVNPTTSNPVPIMKSKKKGSKKEVRIDSLEVGKVNPTTSNPVPVMKSKKKKGSKKKVRIDSKPKQIRHVELFRPSSDAYTPRMNRKNIKYKPAEERANMEHMVSTTMGTIQKPNFQDALRRVAMIIQQHIVKIEQRFETTGGDRLNLFAPAMRDAFAEENFITPRYKCTMVKVPMARGGVVYGMRKIRLEPKIPSADDIYEFGHRLFKQVQLSSECSIICLIYVERLMESAKVPLMATTWKPIFMAGLLLASKVWQDWSSWNIEFASVYPQFSLESINKLELQFLKMVRWDLYISSSLYAKYYFALRSLLEKQDFRRRYVRMVGGVDNVAAAHARKISRRSELLKEKSLAYLSLSL